MLKISGGAVTRRLVPAARPRDKAGVGWVALRRVLRALGRGLRLPLDWALPPRCPGCGVVVASDHSFCVTCWRTLDFLAGPACATCLEPLPQALAPVPRCGACLRDPPPFAELRAAVGYGPIARTLALKLKHGRRPGIARTMARLLRRAGEPVLPGALVVPVPLHRWRLWRRGYNQAALIARAVSRAHGGELAVDLLHRRRATVSLRGQGRSARARTVAGAFAVTPAAVARVAGRRVVLVDDVFTTGATARACATALLRAGASEVRVLCWARAPR